MSVGAPIEERLAAVEAAVLELRRQLSPPPDPGWLAAVVGSQRGEPAFDEVLTLGREYRGGGSILSV